MHHFTNGKKNEGSEVKSLQESQSQDLKSFNLFTCQLLEAVSQLPYRKWSGGPVRSESTAPKPIWDLTGP